MNVQDGIRRAFNLAGKSAYQVSLESGIATGQLYKYLNGGYSPTLLTASVIAKTLGLKTSELVRLMESDREIQLHHASKGPSSITAISRIHHTWVERMGFKKAAVLELLAIVSSDVGKAITECREEYPTKDFPELLAAICLGVFFIAESRGLDLQSEILRKMNIMRKEGRGSRII